MSHHSFGQLFRITTWGESHGKAIGVVIDGCPANLPLLVTDIQQELDRRAPGNDQLVSPRKESDLAEIMSGVFEGVTTGAPISIIIPNRDADSSKYEEMKDLYRPGHANYTYLKKYGVFDYRGGGRASARETACRVAAGSVAKKLLGREGIEIMSTLAEVGGHRENHAAIIEQAKKEGDSVGGIIETVVGKMPVGLGEPLYHKLEAQLAAAMLSIPACKGFEMGTGFEAAAMRGSEHNDPFCVRKGEVRTKTNHAGGSLGGISNGMPLTFRVPFKPTSSIHKEQMTVNREGREVPFKLPEGSRHDPCVAIRAVPVVEAMCALVLVDFLLMRRMSCL